MCEVVGTVRLCVGDGGLPRSAETASFAGTSGRSLSAHRGELSTEPSTKDEEESDSPQVAGLKMLVHKVLGHSEVPRRPLLRMTEEEGDALVSGEAIRAVLAEEERLTRGE